MRPGERLVSDPALTDIGKLQAELVATHLAGTRPPEARIQHDWNGRGRTGYAITHLYCSPMLRSLQTAQPIGLQLGLNPEVWIELHEEGGLCLDQGDGKGMAVFPGRTRSEIQADFPGYVLPEAITAQGWWSGPAEAREGCFTRARQVAERLRARAASDERIAIVTHGNFIDALLKTLFAQDMQDPFFYLHYNTALSYLDFRPKGHITMWYQNRTTHLPVELIS